MAEQNAYNVNDDNNINIMLNERDVNLKPNVETDKPQDHETQPIINKDIDDDKLPLD